MCIIIWTTIDLNKIEIIFCPILVKWLSLQVLVNYERFKITAAWFFCEFTVLPPQVYCTIYYSICLTVHIPKGSLQINLLFIQKPCVLKLGTNHTIGGRNFYGKIFTGWPLSTRTKRLESGHFFRFTAMSRCQWLNVTPFRLNDSAFAINHSSIFRKTAEQLHRDFF